MTCHRENEWPHSTCSQLHADQKSSETEDQKRMPGQDWSSTTPTHDDVQASVRSCSCFDILHSWHSF